ncbi:hypothetical protein Tco_0789374 [Tanacetum coccineum]
MRLLETQKTLLKQQYKNFSASSAESLDFIFNRLQKIVSRLAILVVWMNKPEVETMSIDDLYNNFKIIEQKVKKSVGASSGAQNLAFMTTPSTSSTNDANTASPQVVPIVIRWDTFPGSVEHQGARKVSSEIKTTPGSKETIKDTLQAMLDWIQMVLVLIGVTMAEEQVQDNMA